jgi:hypothetical protein
MPEPSYDFFATSHPVAAPDAAVGTPGGPTHSPPSDPSWAYDPGAVNQFGTPLDVAPAPTGPFAAPGVAAAPIAAPGMVSTWSGPGHPGRAAHAVHPPSIPAERPGTVLAAGVLSIINGALGIVTSVLGLAALAAFSSAISSAGDGVGATVLPIVQVVLAITLVLGVVWLVLGIGVVRGGRTSLRWLRGVVIVSALLAAYALLTQPSMTNLGSAVWNGVLLWLLYCASTTAWLRSS